MGHLQSRDTRSAYARARGLGSAKSGTQHWWQQRVSAVLLVPLLLWFVLDLLLHLPLPYAEARIWAATPIRLGLLLLLLNTMLYHAQKGMQVIIEDYIHHEGLRFSLLSLTNFSFLVLALAGSLALLFIAFGD